jgi:hypothetical protein
MGGPKDTCCRCTGHGHRKGDARCHDIQLGFLCYSPILKVRCRGPLVEGLGMLCDLWLFLWDCRVH